ncbi:MAG TPA: MoaD family protein [Methylomirabilota bacterium]|nr:MoaD family protein [Methylomirabilota bacterium]
MGVSVYIPTPFRRVTQDKSKVELDVSSVEQLLNELEKSFSGMKGLVRDDAGEIHNHVNIYVNNEAIDALQGLATPLKDGDEVSIIPAIAGGRSAPWR